jgi:hypothetical protein
MLEDFSVRKPLDHENQLLYSGQQTFRAKQKREQSVNFFIVKLRTERSWKKCGSYF